MTGSLATPYIAARKVTASMTKHTWTPQTVVMSPAITGPVSMLTWSAIRLSARPAVSRWLPRSLAVKDLLAGAPAAPKPASIPTKT